MKAAFASMTMVLVVWAFGAIPTAQAQETASPQLPAWSSSAPTFARIDGELKTAEGAPRSGTVALTISLYSDGKDSVPLWSEQQLVTLDQAGRYSVFAGATQQDGIPGEFFVSGSGRWLGVAAEGETEHVRIMLVTVPYALKAREAETLAGRNASEFVLSENLATSVKSALKADGEGAAAGETDPGTAGTSGRIAKFDATGLPANVVDSVIFENGAGNVGVGTVSPLAKLQVNGSIRALSGGSLTTPTIQVNHDDMGFFAPAVNAMGVVTASVERIRIQADGRVGIGTPSPLAKLHVNGGVRAIGSDSPVFPAIMVNHDDMGLYAPALNSMGVATNGIERIRITSGGNVGIGTTNPLTKFHVNGDTTIDGNIAAKYQDVAEWVDSVESLEPGTVVVVDPTRPNHVLPATRAYDTSVAGAVSLQPGLILGERADGREMVAQSGRVRVKVDAKYGAIKIGDLLVTSPTPGHAMRSRPMKIGTASLHRPGTLVGKALEAMPKGKGEILVLLTLQ